MSILYLESNDFVVTPGNPEKDKSAPTQSVLRNKITKSFSLILFYTSGDKCQYCPGVKQLFPRLVGKVSNCQVGMINVSLYPQIYQMSQSTTTPIEFVPLIIFYVNGVPFKQFGGNYTEENLLKFATEVSKLAYTSAVSGEEIPEYTIGRPLSKKVCYLNFENAYS